MKNLFPLGKVLNIAVALSVGPNEEPFSFRKVLNNAVALSVGPNKFEFLKSKDSN